MRWPKSCLTCMLVFITIDICFGEYGDYVTCGSLVKLVNAYKHVRLHSHDVKYGSGSGQQSVTAVTGAEDHNSYWQVKGKQGTDCERGKEIKCGQTIRLMHMNTRKNLHSHHFQSPLSNNFEVSAFGDDGVGDAGDNWVVQCQDSITYWERDDRVRFKHTVTDSFLHVTGDTFGRPIHGQMEVCCYKSMMVNNLWSVMEGVYIQPKEQTRNNYHEEHDEL